MCERNTTDERDRAAKLFASLSKAHPYLVDHASHIDGEFNNALHDLRRLVDRLNAERDARPDERAVREAIRNALTDCAYTYGRETAVHANILHFRDEKYPLLPTPIPPCPLSGGREVRWDGTHIWVHTPVGVTNYITSRETVCHLCRNVTDLRTLADWLDSLPDAERGKA